MNKKVLIGLGVLAVAGVGYYLYKRKQGLPTPKEEAGNSGGNPSEEKASAIGVGGSRNLIVSNEPLERRRRWVRNKYDADLKNNKF